MTRYRIPSKSTCSALTHLLKGAAYGYEIMKATGLKSGTLYPILMRLSERDLLSSKWDAPIAPGKPPRQIYKLTTKGRAWAMEVTKAEIESPSLKEVKI